jgi:hypothetical protein
VTAAPPISVMTFGGSFGHFVGAGKQHWHPLFIEAVFSGNL